MSHLPDIRVVEDAAQVASNAAEWLVDATRHRLGHWIRGEASVERREPRNREQLVTAQGCACEPAQCDLPLPLN